MQDQCSVAYEIFKGVSDVWRRMAKPTHCARQDNVHWVEWQSGAHTLRLVLNVNDLRAKTLILSALLIHWSGKKARSVIRDTDINVLDDDGIVALDEVCDLFATLTDPV